MYFLDTNACIAFINGEPASVRHRIEAAFGARSELAISTVVMFELWYGVVKSPRRDFNEERLRRFQSAPILTVPFDADDSRVAAELRVELERVGRPISAYDLLIAAQALRREWILVTANVREFGRIKGLAWQDWSRGHS